MAKRASSNTNWCFRFLAFGSLLVTLSVVYMATYMVFSPLSCHWSTSKSATSRRIALIADPQMEGDTKVYHQGQYGLLNNYFNDYYFTLIFQNVHYFLQPDTIYMLGDLFSSQHVSNEEFDVRVERYNRNFSGLFKWINRLLQLRSGDLKEEEYLQKNVRSETSLRNLPFPYLVNLTGNHDIGYGIEASFFRVQRFIGAFGVQNRKDIILEKGNKKVIAVTLNSMVLDGAEDKAEFRATWDMVEEVRKMKQSMKDDLEVVLFIHVPLHKPKGACVDRPYIRWSEGEEKLPIEQNMLSPRVSQILLDQLKPKYIFNGHDHFGCKYQHKEGAMEITVKSVQGDFAGNVGLFEIESKNGQLEYKYKDCEYYPTKVVVGFLGGVAAWIAFVILVIVLRIIKFVLCCEFISRKAKND
ncbi:hypothetical protein C9374_013327 [Naegleria lovaniensis]|uniref:Calcineurin-like phosphoesterase domain-containing protein n=1 Tax=Naegleria lovaniensis TaxID=51637 RepID=A0AA88H1Y3_NAELO|nr:uncharacterized protein C9374_013327 [Naegleria lovaniensis]KAG2391842.1 hypothetical protein C9374_013327 [Naegleria lovaniensis]